MIIITVFVVLKHRRSIAAKCRRDTSDDELEVCETPQIRELPEPTEEQALIELQPLPSYPDWFTSNLQSKLRDRLIEPSQLVVHSELVHKGKFGAIYKGTCRGVDGRDQVVCAVKTIAGIHQLKCTIERTSNFQSVQFLATYTIGARIFV